MKRGRDKGEKKSRDDRKEKMNSADLYDTFVARGRSIDKDTDHAICMSFPMFRSRRTIPKSIKDTFRITKLDVKKWIKMDFDTDLLKRLERVDDR